jgi:hypothetical protein
MPRGVNPFRIKFIPLPELDAARTPARLKLNEGQPLIQHRAREHPVAVVGGGPSLISSLPILREWPGDIWAINRTADWLLDRGIDCIHYTVDPADMERIPTTAARRLLASWCHPDRFKGCQVEMFDLVEHAENGVPGGTTTATRAPVLAMRMGYPAVHFFGCDSSFERQDHVDRHDPVDEAVIVRANGRDFTTYPEFLMQAECLSEIINLAPQFFVNRSGGLLEAMLQDSQWEVVGISAALKEHLIELNGDCGLYDSPYVPISQE